MGEVAGAFVPCRHRFLHSGVHVRRWRGRGKVKVVGPKWEWDSSKSSKSQPSIKNEMKTSNFSSRISTDLPLFESPGASFDEYLDDRPRVFKAIFPDKRRSQRLNEEEWRVQMLPIQLLFLTVWPVIDMRLRSKSQGKNYPPGVPIHVTRVLELDVTRWEIQGLDSVIEPSHFMLGVRGILYPDRNGVRCRLKGELEMNLNFVLPNVLVLVPEDVLQSIAESVLKRLVENMKHKVNESLLSDFSEFKKETLMKLG